MEIVEVKFGEWFDEGFTLYKENFGLLVLSSLVFCLLSGITFGILLGPMMAGLVLIIFGLVDKSDPEPGVGIIFKGFDFFVQSFLLCLVWGLAIIIGSIVLSFIPVLGQLASLFGSYALQALLMFAMFLIVDKKMDFWTASMESMNRVKTNFWPFLGLFAVTAIISSAGAIACGIGIIFTIPIQFCILTVAYKDVYSAIQTDAPIIEDSPADQEETNQ
ncbi:MAG: hypothetical protein HN737_08465 [Desulfobacterales bacterium]|jgi:hypothetical protein|nr:hypothetical protein [Desulfobacteraceae bacterium]MBT4365401.1 hypothetical protein [Desulfobacteraceae bacterium]MBT7087138.1 hypothetical protein [Desulfobacterales bacterium]MBT7697429.1 hypothetical protein [Desulfobacterales bacterium]